MTWRKPVWSINISQAITGPLYHQSEEFEQDFHCDMSRNLVRLFIYRITCPHSHYKASPILYTMFLAPSVIYASFRVVLFLPDPVEFNKG